MFNLNDTKKMTEAALMSALFVVGTIFFVSTGLGYTFYLDFIVPIFFVVICLKCDIKYSILSDTDVFLDSERHPQTEKKIQLNKKYDVILSLSEQSGSYTVLTWQDGLIQYRLLGDESEKILLQIAESIIP